MNIIARINKSESFPTSLSRRSFMVGAAGLTFAFATGVGPADAAVLAHEKTGKAISPWVSIAPDGTITIMSAATDRKSTRLNSSH